ncbi:NADP-dependent oxidoreductase [Pseudoalteromonas sp. Scap03]|uniref:NADP-dependent oxidoreductase n=1 Tax=unclassified Pseudoalteromonas TaxID=194690 RepID=UPI0015B7E730|nr:MULTISPECIES: NADP-dependent oxidoreductase [unclassified Pseudoalteromonas]NWL17074.1 NADP-dependent oxidoreductase [Pseudoalteromonas sp. Scap03]QLE83122.1 NADP-dependent oxidoreductase [Pseudoalteromonas sp. Scap25]QLE91064.1 NADP-dependent oxidoreductase [Pseudoalteromonas sp. Scap06]
MSTTSRQFTLASRPYGAPTNENFELKNVELPSLKDGEVLLRTIYLSLDPYMRGRMSDAKSYADPVEIGDVMVGATVCQVESSKNDKFSEGEWVLAYTGWQTYAISNGEGLMSLGKEPTNPSYALGIMGMPGFTAYMGLLDIGAPKAGETVVVAAATGPVGATVGQIAKIKGCKVVGVAGGSEKCAHAVETLGFDACIDHKAEDFAEQLEKACEQGIDVYYENVGGKVFDAVLPLLNTSARVPICGLVSQYNATSLPEGPDRLGMLMGQLLTKRIKMQGFIIFDDYGDRYDEFAQDMQKWLQDGKVQYREYLVDGFEKTISAFNDMISGKNFGKTVVKINSPL